MSEVVAVVRMNKGRWIADCPRPDCPGAEAFGCRSAARYGPGLTGEWFHCRPAVGGCGLRCDAQWPAEVETIERLLLARPVPGTRNWFPGETVHDLLAENILHGILPDGPMALVAGSFAPLPAAPPTGKAG